MVPSGEDSTWKRKMDIVKTVLCILDAQDGGNEGKNAMHCRQIKPLPCVLCKRKIIFLLLFSELLDGLIIKVTWDRLRGENYQPGHICTCGGSLRLGDPWINRAGEAYMPLWTKERETGIRDFRGKVGNSQVDEKERMSGKQWDTERSLTNRLCRFLRSATLRLYDAKVLAALL